MAFGDAAHAHGLIHPIHEVAAPRRQLHSVAVSFASNGILHWIGCISIVEDKTFGLKGAVKSFA
jgi:hypothetical protein